MPAKEGERQQGISEDDLQGVDAKRYYEERKAFYQNESIAAGYDGHRFKGARSLRNWAKWRAIRKALRHAGLVRTILDLPTGTGRFVQSFLEEGHALVGADISHAMMREAAAKLGKEPPSTMLGFIQCDAEALPFRDGSFDAVVSIRFFMHLTPEVRVKVLSEFARVSRKWVIVDYRHRHAPRNVLKRWAHSLGLRPPAPPRVSLEDIESEAFDAGLHVIKVFEVTPIFSDKWVVLLERRLAGRG